MKRACRVPLVLVFSLLLPTSSFGAKVKRRNSETVEGTITGLIVVKLRPEATEKAKNTAVYRAFSGVDILVIDENGFQVAAGKTLQLAVHAGEPAALPLDAAILQMALKQRAFKYLSRLKKAEVEQLQFPGGLLFVCADCVEERVKTPPYRLLGEFRPGEGWGTIVPAIQIQTANGLVAIPVNQVISSGDAIVSAPEEREKEVLEKTETPLSAETDASPQEVVIAAKTVAVVASGVQAPKGFGRIFDRRMARSDADRARTDVEGEVSKWGRYTVVSDPAAADLVLKIVAFETGEELAVLQGGAATGRSGRLLWLRDVRGEFAIRAARFLRKEIEEAEKQQKK